MLDVTSVACNPYIGALFRSMENAFHHTFCLHKILSKKLYDGDGHGSLKCSIKGVSLIIQFPWLLIPYFLL